MNGNAEVWLKECLQRLESGKYVVRACELHQEPITVRAGPDLLVCGASGDKITLTVCMRPETSR